MVTSDECVTHVPTLNVRVPFSMGPNLGSVISPFPPPYIFMLLKNLVIVYTIVFPRDQKFLCIAPGCDMPIGHARMFSFTINNIDVFEKSNSCFNV